MDIHELFMKIISSKIQRHYIKTAGSDICNAGQRTPLRPKIFYGAPNKILTFEAKKARPQESKDNT
jgi:hypothetical protein